MKEGNCQELIDVIKFVMLGENLPTLRGIAGEWKNLVITIYFYNDGEVTEEIAEAYSCIATEVLAHFDYATIDEHIIRRDIPLTLPEHDHWALKK